jgi:hypothetical protein
MKLYSFDYDGFRGYANAQTNWTLVVWLLSTSKLEFPSEPLTDVDAMREWLTSAGNAEFDTRSNVAYGFYKSADHQLFSQMLSKIDERGYISSGTFRMGFQRWRGKHRVDWTMLYRLQDPN